MTKRKYVERRLLVISQRRTPSDEGLARLVAAMILQRLSQQAESSDDRKDSA